MPRKMISDLKAGEPVDDVYLLCKNELKSSRNDSLYLDLLFRDKSGTVTGRMWDASEKVYEAFAADDFVHVKGRVEQYRNEMQISVKTLSQPDMTKLRLRDFMAQSERDPLEMEKDLRQLLSVIQDPDYRRLVDAFLADEEFMTAFRTAPAAIVNHHAYLGGLIEHTLSMMRLAVAVADNYPRLRRDILLTGILLHDIGKVREIRYNRSFQMSDPGQLIGHLTQGAIMTQEKAASMGDFPEEKLSVALHMILSHHGTREFGSPVLPMTAEAFALHFIDNLDAKTKTVAEMVDADANSRSTFTNYVNNLERRLYKK